MLGLKRLFNSKLFNSKLIRDSFLSFDKPIETAVIYAPGTTIVFDTGLVAKLKRDHVQLVEVFTDMVKNAEQRNYEKLHNLLAVFLALFNAHALTEYTKLYVFLDYLYRADHINHELVMCFRREMNDIGKSVRQFAHSWRDTGINSGNLHAFKKDIHQIGEVLTKRIDVEEHRLYEMYNAAPALLRLRRISSH